MRRIFGLEGGWPPVGLIRWGSLGRLQPINRSFGFTRGKPIDRFYLEAFLAEHAEDIKGRVLEMGDPGYTQRYGGEMVSRSDVLHPVTGNRYATMVGRLDTGEGLEWGVYDCLVVTQTLHCIFDIRTAVTNLSKLLKVGGVVLASVPGISQISRYDADRWGDYWRLTPQATLDLFESCFAPANIEVRPYGNVLAAVAFLHGLVVADLPRGALEKQDPDYPLLICVRAVKGRA
ncbi:MAG: methyltransferase [Anaerolineales bacterium]|jgi:hypothetical protein